MKWFWYVISVALFLTGFQAAAALWDIDPYLSMITMAAFLFWALDVVDVRP